MRINNIEYPSTTHYIVYLKKQNKYSDEQIIDLLMKHWDMKRMSALSILEWYYKENGND